MRGEVRRRCSECENLFEADKCYASVVLNAWKSFFFFFRRPSTLDFVALTSRRFFFKEPIFPLSNLAKCRLNVQNVSDF